MSDSARSDRKSTEGNLRKSINSPRWRGCAAGFLSLDKTRDKGQDMGTVLLSAQFADRRTVPMSRPCLAPCLALPSRHNPA